MISFFFSILLISESGQWLLGDTPNLKVANAYMEVFKDKPR